jgi:hypothetical protein
VKNGSLAEVFAAICREIPQPLLDRVGALRVMEIAETLPPEVARGPVGLELRLAGDTHGDLYACGSPRTPAGTALLGWAERNGITRLAQALEGWRSGFGWLAWNARCMLLEFDAVTDAHALPCVYLTPAGAANDGPVEVSDNAFHIDPNGLVNALAALSGAPPDPTAASDLERLLSVLPPYAEIFAAGAMLSRGSVGSPRIVVRRLRPEGIDAILATLGRPEVAEELVPVAAELEPLDARLTLCIDLGSSAPALSGVEAHGRSWTEGSAEGWAPVFDVLVARGVAVRARAEAAARLPGPMWPDGPVVGISHVKVSADADGLRPAKLYVGIAQAHKVIGARLGVGRDAPAAVVEAVAV